MPDPVAARSLPSPGVAFAGRTFDAVLFDMDGTLIDSVPAVNRSWRRMASEHGLPDPDDWVVGAYSRIRFHQDPKNREYGYGIISYPWGKYWNRTDTVPEKDAPDGIDWKIPRLAKDAISLDEAKKVITSMGKRYVWWDWMCVPQGGSHKDIAEQEIGKQM